MYESHYVDGKVEGIKEGLQKGIKKGIKEGGKIKSIQIAKSLLENNVDIKIIISSTGLTKEEIESLE